MNERDRKIIISVFGIVAFVALAAGAAYAYFSFVTNSIVVESTNGKLDIDYNISDPELTGVLIPSATRSGGILEVATAKLNPGSLDAAINFYITPTSISGFPLSALCYDVDVLDASEEVIDTYTGTFDSASLNSPLKIIDAYDLSPSLLTFNIYIWLDGSKINNENFNSNNSFSATLTADSVQITGEFDPLPNPITDYEYELGTGIAEGYVILKKYIGTSPNVLIPDSYEIDDIEYDTLLFIQELSNGTKKTTFLDNNVIQKAVLPSNYYSMVDTYRSGKNISNQIMNYMFSGCTSLVDVPVIPNTVTDMTATFMGCTSLVDAPVIPSSVTSLGATFKNCTSLVNAPAIPNGVTNMCDMFMGCTSLVTAPEIPNSVTNIINLFHGCINLEGTVKISSTNVSTYGVPSPYEHPFNGTSKSITVMVPEGSATYTNLNNGYKPSNITVTTFTP